MSWLRGLVGLLALAAVVLTTAFAASSRRPPVSGDGVSLVPTWAAAGTLVLLIVCGFLIVVAAVLRRRVDVPEDRDVGRGSTVVLVLFVVLLLAPQFLGGLEVDGVAGGIALPATGTSEPSEAGRVTPSVTATLAGVLAVVLAVAAVAARTGSNAGRGDDGPDDDGPPEELPAAPDGRSERDPAGDPRLVVLAAYDAARRLVEPAVGASPNDGPLAVLARTRGTAAADAFEDLTRTYLPLRFGLDRADDRAAERARSALAHLQRELGP